MDAVINKLPLLLLAGFSLVCLMAAYRYSIDTLKEQLTKAEERIALLEARAEKS